MQTEGHTQNEFGDPLHRKWNKAARERCVIVCTEFSKRRVRKDTNCEKCEGDVLERSLREAGEQEKCEGETKIEKRFDGECPSRIVPGAEELWSARIPRLKHKQNQDCFDGAEAAFEPQNKQQGQEVDRIDSSKARLPETGASTRSGDLTFVRVGQDETGEQEEKAHGDTA